MKHQEISVSPLATGPLYSLSKYLWVKVTREYICSLLLERSPNIKIETTTHYAVITQFHQASALCHTCFIWPSLFFLKYFKANCTQIISLLNNASFFLRKKKVGDRSERSLYNCNISIIPIKNNMDLLISPNSISKFIFLWLSKTKTKAPQWWSLPFIQNQGLNKICSLHVGSLLRDMNWSSMTQSTLGSWEQTVKHQEILTPGWIDPRCLDCWKHPCPPSDLSKLDILISFHCSSVTRVVLLTRPCWLMSLVGVLQGVAILNYQASDQHWCPCCRDKESYWLHGWVPGSPDGYSLEIPKLSQQLKAVPDSSL